MVFEGVGNIVGRRLAPGMTVHFRDGAKARLEPDLKVFRVTAPGGKTCDLSDNAGMAYLAALCSHRDTAEQIKKRLGAHPYDLAGRPENLPEDNLPEIESVIVDVYV